MNPRDGHPRCRAACFHRAILESPGVPTPRAKVTPLTELGDAEKMAVEYARALGVTGDGTAALVKDKVTTADKAMAKLASAYWVAFGLAGDPNGGGRPAWPRYGHAADRVIDFTDSGAVVGPDPLKARLDLWGSPMSWGRAATS